MKKFFSLFLAVFLFMACETTPSETGDEGETNLAGWTTVDAGVFTVTAPQGWTYTREQGIDSTIGLIEGDGISLEFDYGMYSGFLDNGTEDNYNIQETTIDGYNAQIATPKITGEGLTMVFFEEVRDGNRFNLYGRDLSADQEAIALQIFQTIKFKQ